MRLIVVGAMLAALLALRVGFGPVSVQAVEFLWLAAAIALPVWAAAAALFNANRFFTRRSEELRLNPGEATGRGLGLCVAAGAAALSAVLVAEAGGHQFIGVPRTPRGWAIEAAVWGTVHGVTSWVAWLALKRETEPVRAAWVAVGTATVWLAAIVAGMIASAWVW